VRVTSQGQPRTIFKRAVERKNLLLAEVTAREIGRVDLQEALSLVLLVAELQPARLDAFGRRWLARVASERKVSLAELDMAVTALRALPSERAAAALREIAK
jgi:hypothetical protein